METNHDWSRALREYGPMVWQTVYRILWHEQDAHDCYQDTFLAAFKQVTDGGNNPVKNWTAMLRVIATRKAIDRLRRRATAQARGSSAHLGAPVEGASVSTSPVARIERNELAERLAAAIAQLPDREAQVFALRHIEEMDYDQIAQELALSPSNVGTLLARARVRLRRLLAAENPINPRSSVSTSPGEVKP